MSNTLIIVFEENNKGSIILWYRTLCSYIIEHNKVIQRAGMYELGAL